MLFQVKFLILNKPFLFFQGTGKPVTIRSSIYVESFGNIEEANMVR